MRYDGAVRTTGTEPLDEPGVSVPEFVLKVVEGANVGATWRSTGDRCAIGAHASNDLVLDDPKASRFHCEIVLESGGARVRDLGSRNGTIVNGVRLTDGFLADRSVLRLGKTLVQFDFGAGKGTLAVSERGVFGGLVGQSVGMRAVLAQLERAASTNATVLLEGETGTGKDIAASSLHESSTRRKGPFVVVDCGAMPGGLIESTLFGHEQGAFTGAVRARAGAFEEADGGTVFLDEIGELAPEMQPKLLRILEKREVRRIGSSETRSVDVRIVAATHRDLRSLVNTGLFRADLYFRLAVVRVHMPALRDRPEDIPLIAERILHGLGAAPEAAARLLTPELIERMRQLPWLGNVRELRNYLERCLVLSEPVVADTEKADPARELAIDLDVPFTRARTSLLEHWEKRYLRALLEAHSGNTETAAKAAGIHRATLYRMIERLGLRDPS
jgi:transcriptional regulator with PAS, ATPase and Fis domain